MSRVHELAREVRDLETLNDGVRTVGGSDREGVDDASRDSVGSIGRNGHGDELILGGSKGPITHMVNGSNGSRSSRRETTGLDDGGSALLDVRDEVTLNPSIVTNLLSSLLTINSSVRSIRVLGGRVVTPDDDVLDGGSGNTRFGGEESLGSVVVETSHGSEVLLGDVGSTSLSDKSIGVSGVTDNQNLNGLLAVIIQSSTLLAEDSGILGQQLLTLHTSKTRERTNQKGIVQASEGLLDVSGSDDACRTPFCK